MEHKQSWDRNVKHWRHTLEEKDNLKSNSNSHLKKLAKGEENKPKQAEDGNNEQKHGKNETENRKLIEKNQWNKLFFVKVDKTDKTLARLTKKKKRYKLLTPGMKQRTSLWTLKMSKG